MKKISEESLRKRDISKSPKNEFVEDNNGKKKEEKGKLKLKRRKNYQWMQESIESMAEDRKYKDYNSRLGDFIFVH